MAGQLILINGASSAGKTTLCRALRDTLPAPFLHFSLDFFIQAFVGLLRQLHPNLRRVLIDPETRNTRARHVYAKVGFAPLATVEVEGKALALMGLELLAVG